jgi:hypothetical protein
VPIPPIEAFNAAPTACVQVNVSWLSHVQGLLERAQTSGYWDENEYEGQQAILEIQNLIALGECPVSIYQLDEVILAYTQPQNVNGGSSVATTWTNVNINTILIDTTASVNLTPPSFLLPAGVWSVEAQLEYLAVTGIFAQVRMRILEYPEEIGINTRAGGSINRKAQFQTNIQTDGITPLHLQYWSSSARPDIGLGQPSNIPTYREIYTVLKLVRLNQLN